MLNLTRPLVWVDVESTGTDPAQDRIVQLGIVKWHLSGDRKSWTTLVNPGVPIPKEATDTHGITDEMVKDAPRFADIAEGLAVGFRGCDFGGYNIRRFDIPILNAEFSRCRIAIDLMSAHAVDAYVLDMKMRPRDLSAYVREYLGRELEGAHDAGADITGTAEAFEAFMQRFSELPRTPKELHDLAFGDSETSLAGGKFTFRNGKCVMTFGKHKNVPLDKVDPNYLRWVLKSDFPPEVKNICDAALRGVYPEPKK